MINLTLPPRDFGEQITGLTAVDLRVGIREDLDALVLTDSDQGIELILGPFAAWQLIFKMYGGLMRLLQESDGA